ncbi:MAG: phosphate acyltransferase PlsX [Clostridiales bacterium]|nr:phosphate acyltransferase PlsX [Clostridiales bacterium]
MKKILIDVMGCDNPDAVIDGLALAINATEDVTLIACGDKTRIENRLKDKEFDSFRLEIINAPDEITNNDKSVNAVLMKKQSSLIVSLNTLKTTKDIPVMITAGSTGALIAGSILILGRNKPDDRATLVTHFPTDKGGMAVLADCGANVDCGPEHLLKFAQYANDYVKKVYGVENPRIGLLSNGTEDSKGSALTLSAFKLLKEDTSLNFIGNMEAKTTISGDYDVVVSDGFSGNVLLKSIEGTAISIIKRAMACFKQSVKSPEEMQTVKKAFNLLLSQLDFNSTGGSVLLGVRKPVIKAHGSANSDTVVHTVKQAIHMIECGFAK